jgi:hypothetical protein
MTQTPIQAKYQDKMIRMARKKHRQQQSTGYRVLMAVLMICVAALVGWPLLAGIKP